MAQGVDSDLVSLNANELLSLQEGIKKKSPENVIGVAPLLLIVYFIENAMNLRCIRLITGRLKTRISMTLNRPMQIYLERYHAPWPSLLWNNGNGTFKSFSPIIH